MKQINLLSLWLFAFLTVLISANAQNKNGFVEKKEVLSETQLKRWSHLDLAKDSIPGMSVDKAYTQLLKGKKGVKVIVAVIDSGVDIDHEDLKSVIWTNNKEIPNNGIDDDKNGYIDDIHGWNFLGNSNNETMEITRILKKGEEDSEIYKSAKIKYDQKYLEALDQQEQVDIISDANKSVADYLNKDNYTLEEVREIKTINPYLSRNVQIMTSVISQFGTDFNEKINDFKEQTFDRLNYHLNLEFDGRKLVGDNPNDIKDTNYGNNIVYGPDKKGALHGTHVAGIIAGVRNNNKGGDGITSNAKIMSIRAVPNGDEYDKDVALAIRYAVNNGAKVINGSFGKSISPNKEWVFDAIKYAESKDVLVVIAAGNDGEDVDVPENTNFPNDSKDNKTEFSTTLLMVGALGNKYGESVITDFSNYGSFNVDVFAPGENIYSTVPNNNYKYEDGTSMASPNAAGVAALIRSYYPKLSAVKVKKIMMDSGTSLPAVVELGKNHEKKTALETSRSGKMINAYRALIMAEKLAKQK